MTPTGGGKLAAPLHGGPSEKATRHRPPAAFSAALAYHFARGNRRHTGARSGLKRRDSAAPMPADAIVRERDGEIGED
jgi:hypothetical protein